MFHATKKGFEQALWDGGTVLGKIFFLLQFLQLLASQLFVFLDVFFNSCQQETRSFFSYISWLFFPNFKNIFSSDFFLCKFAKIKSGKLRSVLQAKSLRLFWYMDAEGWLNFGLRTYHWHVSGLIPSHSSEKLARCIFWI
jgi:hypothetical protein